MGSVVCKKCEVEEGYQCLLTYLKENKYQIIGDTVEWRIGEHIELIVPIHKLHERLEYPENDDINVPFIDDPEVVGHWKVIASETTVYTKEAFNPDRIKDSQIDGTIQDIYFLPEGEEYWCFRWSKGVYLLNGNLETMPTIMRHHGIISLQEWLYRTIVCIRITRKLSRRG